MSFALMSLISLGLVRSFNGAALERSYRAQSGILNSPFASKFCPASANNKTGASKSLNGTFIIRKNLV